MASHQGGGTSSTGGTVTMRESRMPKYSKFSQQELPAFKPILTPRWMICILLAVGFAFIPIGVITLLASRAVVEIVEPYNNCFPSNLSLTTNQERLKHIQEPVSIKRCSLPTIFVPRRMSAPIFVYFELDHFYQNHRRYIKSRSDVQLRGKDVNDVGGCSPEDIYPGNGKPIIPCGLIAWSLFNDSYIFSIGSEVLTVQETGISWKSDRDSKFGSNVFPSNFPNNIAQDGDRGGARLNELLPLNQQEHLIVWMRPAPLPKFRKLWGKLDRDLEAGTLLSVTIDNRYNVYSFGGHKKLVLSTASWLGGKNSFFGRTFLSVGIISVLLAAVFFLIHVKYPRRLGDMSRLSWNRSDSFGSDSAQYTR